MLELQELGGKLSETKRKCFTARLVLCTDYCLLWSCQIKFPRGKPYFATSMLTPPLPSTVVLAHECFNFERPQVCVGRQPESESD